MKRPRIRIPWRRITSGRALPWVLAVVFLATTLVNWWLLHEDNQDDARVAAVTDTATGFIHAFTNYNAQDIEQNVATIQSYAVGGFASQVKATFNQATIDRIKATGVHVTGTTWNLAVHDMSEAAAHIRSLVYETLTTTRGSPTTEWVQFELEMVLAGDAWKVDDVKANILEPSTGPSPTG